MNKKSDVYQMVTDRIMESLEAGIIPWNKPWSAGTGSFPKNFASGHQYRGINVAVLWAEASRRGYASNDWVTFKQAKGKGGSVRKGEKGTPVVFWKWLEKEDVDANGNTKKSSIPFLRYYTVFNVDQCDGLTANAEAVEDFQPIERCEQIVDGFSDKPVVTNDGGSRAYYVPAFDAVHMPKPEQFKSAEGYYGVLFHELAHSTGHTSRLNRKDLGGSAFGGKSYSREELVAEMTSAFLCAETHIDTPEIQENETAYIQSWLKALADDRKLVVMAGAQAQKAADWIHGKKPGK